MEKMARLGHDDLPTRRLLFRKIIKGFEEKDFALGLAQTQIRQLETRIEQLQPRKRRKVRTSPNSKFADIKAIREAQILTEEQEIEEIESELAIDSDSIVSAI